MPMFWSKKSKAEKNYDAAKSVKPAKSIAGKAVKAAKEGKTVAAVGKPTKAVKAIVPAIPAGAFGTIADSIIRPRVTEKSGILSQSGVYTFEVAASASKPSIAKAVKALYKVTPVKIAVINQPAKNVFVKGRRGIVSGFRKAMITVKKGDKIDFV
jgi:large subunit ribosomal protein L23